VPFGADTQVVNGQRFTFPTSASYNPPNWGPTSTGVPNVTPSLPPFAGVGSGGSSVAGGVSDNVGGYGTAGNNQATTSMANQNPNNLKVSPVWWAIAALLIGLFLLKSVHWRDSLLEGAKEEAHVGPARESAAEEA
jgi:hypothetical protein